MSPGALDDQPDGVLPGTDNRGRSLADVWAYSDDEMEDVHDFIQWLFPLREPSQFNAQAPLLDDANIAEFRSDPRLRANLMRSFERFLEFLGLRYDDGCITNAGDATAHQRDLWRYPNHNWLRITRVLRSARLLGLEEEARAFFKFLGELKESGRSGIDPVTFRYWEDATRE
jgi:hypothetical protein